MERATQKHYFPTIFHNLRNLSSILGMNLLGIGFDALGCVECATHRRRPIRLIILTKWITEAAVNMLYGHCSDESDSFFLGDVLRRLKVMGQIPFQRTIIVEGDKGDPFQALLEIPTRDSSTGLGYDRAQP